MKKIPCITLLTDFGLEDEYVGVMKGVIVGLAPEVPIIDLCHQVPAQDIRRAGRLLAASYRYFPAGCLHVAVVDPGVGGSRRILCAAVEGHLFLAPDNGLLTEVLDSATTAFAHQVTDSSYFLARVSNTFHGRDIFAPVAGHLAKGLPLQQLGPAVDVATVTRLDLPRARKSGNRIEGQVIAVDRFGNLTTNITSNLLAPWLASPERMQITTGQLTIAGLASSYQMVEEGRPLALISSRDCLEIAVRNGNAARTLGLAEGSVVTVMFRS